MAPRARMAPGAMRPAAPGTGVVGAGAPGVVAEAVAGTVTPVAPEEQAVGVTSEPLSSKGL